MVRLPFFIGCTSILLTTGLLASTASAQAKGLDGQWNGFGKAKLASSGKTENFRCKVTYNRETSKVFGVRAVCASPSIRIIQTGKVLKVRENTYKGELYNQAYDLRGDVRIVVNGREQKVTLTADEGNGVLTLRKR